MVVEIPPRTSPRLLAGLAAACAPALAIVVTYGWWRARLPDPLPTHWGRHGDVDGTMTVAGFLAFTLATALAGAVLAAVGALVSRLGWRVRRTLVVTGATAAAFAAGLWLTITAVALDHADATEIGSPTWHIPVLLVGVAVWAGLAFFACGPAPGHPPATGRPATDLPRVDLPAGQRAAWSELGRPGMAAYAAVLPLLVLSVALGLLVNPWAASPVVLTAALVFFLFITRLSVDRRGLRVGFGPWGWPRLTVPIHEIESAEVTTLRPSDWGGWGYRVRSGGRAVITRRGPGVRLALSGDRRFEVSTRDPETVAGLLNALLDRVPR